MTSILVQPEAESIQQGSDAWHAWRGKGLGASDIAAVMGESEYDTPHSLWMVKTGRAQPKDINRAMEIGMEQEAKIRVLYEFETSTDAPPALFQHPELPWARCSLDGWVENRQVIGEFKCFGAEKHAMVKSGIVPPSYIAQVQWQLFVTGAKVVHFVSLDMATQSDLIILPVTKNLEYWSKMIPAAEAFWKMIETNTPPPLTDRDFLSLDEPGTIATFERWRLAKVAGDEDTMKKVRVVIETIVKASHPKVRCSGVKAYTVQRKNGPTIEVRLD